MCKGATVSTAGGDMCSEKGQIIGMVTWSLTVLKKTLKELHIFECDDVFMDVFYNRTKTASP